MKTFGELTREEKIELVTAWIDDLTIEFFNPTLKEWFESSKSHPPCFNENIAYRIKPTKHSINWDHVHQDYNWLAVDKDGLASVFEKEPKTDCECWVEGGNWVDAKVFISFKPGTCDWKESLVERPKK